MGRHVGPRSGDGAAAGTRREEPRGGDDLGRLEAGALCGPFGGAVGDHTRERLEARDVLEQEGRVEEVLANHDVDHRREDRRILARSGLEEEIGEASDLGLARVDHDQLQAARLRVAKPAGGIRGRDPARHRDQRIVPDEHPDVGLVEDVGAPEPAAVDRVRDVLARLIDRGGGEYHLRAEAEHETDAGRNRGGVGAGVGTGIEGDGARAVLRDDLADPGGDLVHRLLARDRIGTSRPRRVSGSGGGARGGRAVPGGGGPSRR